MLELMKDPKTTLKPLAEKLEMTIQGVSEYLRKMQKDGELLRFGKEYRLTKKSVQSLHDSIQELREFVVAALRQIDIIQVCTAIARTPIKKGERVGLFMEGGRLTAYARRGSSSTGRALADTAPGEDISVTDLEGIVKLSPGRLVIVEIPSAGNVGTRALPLRKARAVMSRIDFDRLGVLDAMGLVMAQRLKLGIDFEFASATAGVEAVQKGLNVLLIGGTEETSRVASMLDEMNNRSTDKVEYEFVRLK
jgi:putative transcriptional regulator